jgi:hypothetical protein
MKIHVVNTSGEFFWFYATKKEAMKKIKQLQKESDQERTEYESWMQSRDEDNVIVVTGGTNKVWVGNYDHIDYDTYEFEPNKKGLIDAMQDGLGLVSGDSIGDTNE